MKSTLTLILLTFCTIKITAQNPHYFNFNGFSIVNIVATDGENLYYTTLDENNQSSIFTIRKGTNSSFPIVYPDSLNINRPFSFAEIGEQVFFLDNNSNDELWMYCLENFRITPVMKLFNTTSLSYGYQLFPSYTFNDRILLSQQSNLFSIDLSSKTVDTLLTNMDGIEHRIVINNCISDSFGIYLPIGYQSKLDYLYTDFTPENTFRISDKFGIPENSRLLWVKNAKLGISYWNNGGTKISDYDTLTKNLVTILDRVDSRLVKGLLPIRKIDSTLFIWLNTSENNFSEGSYVIEIVNGKLVKTHQDATFLNFHKSHKQFSGLTKNGLYYASYRIEDNATDLGFISFSEENSVSNINIIDSLPLYPEGLSDFNEYKGLVSFVADGVIYIGDGDKIKSYKINKTEGNRRVLNLQYGNLSPFSNDFWFFDNKLFFIINKWNPNLNRDLAYIDLNEAGLLSIKNESLQLPTVSIFPNPTNASFTIQSDLDIKTITILDLQGRELLTTNGIDNPIDLSIFGNGIYNAVIYTSSGQKITKRVIKF